MNPEYFAAQWVEVGMFFILGALTGVLANHERAQRFEAEQMATQLAKVNSDLQSCFALLRRAERLSAMGELAAGLAHEIRKPLGAIDCAVQILTRGQEREVDRIGFPQPVKVNVRILAATNRKLKTQIEDGQFREDLFYRLSVVTIDVPPLRERKDDIPLLVSHFLKSFSERNHISPLTITGEALALIVRYPWPGNVRQLENAMERVVVLANGNTIRPEDPPQEVRESESRIAKIDLKLPDEGIDLEQVEKEILSPALQKHTGNQTRAAQYLNISRKTLIYRMEKFGLISMAADETGASHSTNS